MGNVATLFGIIAVLALVAFIFAPFFLQRSTRDESPTDSDLAGGPYTDPTSD